MVKKVLFSVLLFLPLFSGFAQIGREWIVAGQPYYKIPVAEEGIYAISFSQMNSKGISTSDPSRLQVWFRGVEQSALVRNDTLFFYGKGNDGALDSLLYEPMSAHFNKYYSLMSDTTYFFLTVGSSAGKRLASNAAVAGTPVSNHRYTEVEVYPEWYFSGRQYSTETHLSAGDVGEGWISNGIYLTREFTVPVSNVNTSSAIAPELEVVVVGNNSGTHNVDIAIGDGSTVYAVYSLPFFFGRDMYRFKQTLPVSYLAGNKPLVVDVRPKGVTPSVYDYVSVSHIVLKYPQTTALSGQSFYVIEPENDNSDKTMSFSGFNPGAFLWDVSAEGAYTDLSYTYSAGSATTNVSSSVSRIVYAVSSKPVIGLNAVDMTPYPVNSEMLLISHTKLIDAPGSAVQEYADYRRSLSGGGITVALTDVNKLYDLYTYGEKHPMAIKRYCMEQIANGNPKYLFLVGKGINYDYYGRTNTGDFYYRKNPSAFINNTYSMQELNYRMEDLIPPYGWPASDIYYAITDGTMRPKLATGRLSARTNEDVAQYLEKIKATDALTDDQLWRKHLLHLSGGKNPSEINTFIGVVNGFKAIAESPRFGGKVVRSYSKDVTAGAVDPKLISSIADVLNAGISYLTFFGHSSPNIIDLDIGNVSNPVYGYNNKGKYPMLIMNGCQSAEFFLEGSVPENWIMTPEKGAVLTLGHGDIGYIDVMQGYTSLLYRLNFNDSRYIDATVGELHQKTIDTFLTNYASYSSPEVVKAQATQFVLQGDPFTRMYKPLQTDYAVSGDEEPGERKAFIKAYSNTPISAMSDSFAVAIPIINYGLSDPHKIQIKIRHTVTNNNTLVVDKVYPLKEVNPIGYLDTIYFNIQGREPKLFGINKFEILIDPNDSIPEFNETNNVATLVYFVPLSSVTCLYPLEYSVVYEQPVEFIAQSNDLLQVNKDYYIEIDTSHLYNSPAKIVRTVNAGALVRFTQSLLTDNLPSDSLVYYWRVRFADLAGEADTIWGESSFIYIKQSPPGWSQSEYPQFFKDSYRQMEISSTGKMDFTRNTTNLYARTQGGAAPGAGQNVDIGVNSNSIMQLIPAPGSCSADSGLYVVVFNSETALPYVVDPNYVCGVYQNYLVHQFLSLDSYAFRDVLKNFLKSIKSNEVVLFLSAGPLKPSLFEPDLRDIFINDFGAQHFNDLTDRSPYILLARKRAGATPFQEIYSNDETAIIEMNYDLEGIYKSGTVTSTLIGPSSEWGTFYKTVQLSGSDQAEMKVIRINQQGVEVDTIGVPLAGDIDLAPLVDATAFPYIRLLMYNADTLDFTPAYLKKWQVIYAPVPEGTIDASITGIDKYTISDKYKGEIFTLPFAFTNISPLDFPEPLKAVITLRTDKGNLKRDTVTIGSLTVGESISFNYTVDVAQFTGNATLQVYVNPRFQREAYYQNNILELFFGIKIDQTHPVLGAMFDGVHIFDGDLVSPSPVISINMVDDNQLLLMNDSTLTVNLIYNSDGSIHPVNPNNSASLTEFDIPVWTQDPSDKSKFSVQFSPKSDLPDGKYKLVIQGKDATGNKAGTQNYEINFEVVNQSTITNFYPYPNPFSTSCRFVFTLTGKEIPEDIKIQIMTVSGKVVKEIFKSDLGNIHVGDNITDYAWDGRDEFGDRLANGVYIYRVIIKNQGDNFEHRETAGDKAFKKGYGKLYILR